MSAYPIQACALPTLLREIPDPPRKLTIRGTYPDQSLTFLSVVGARTYTPYGRQACERLIGGLAGYPIVVVSGLALGIDGIAHQAALNAGLPTVAVPGSGLDDRVLYPAAHRHLARAILEAGGALISEFEPMWRPRPESFPQRNRIMAGISQAVLVVEAECKSGTLITSKLAAEYNRDVLAVPGPIHSATSSGPHQLIKSGAALITSPEDILEALHIAPRVQGQPPLPLDLSDEERAVVSHLAEPLARDDLVRRIGTSASAANMLITALELKGVITEELGHVRLR